MIHDQVQQGVDLAGGVVDMITAIARAAEVPPEVKVSREARRRAKSIGRLAARYAEQLSRIEGPIDTKRERMALARAHGFAAELRALGYAVLALPPLA